MIIIFDHKSEENFLNFDLHFSKNPLEKVCRVKKIYPYFLGEKLSDSKVLEELPKFLNVSIFVKYYIHAKY